MTTTMSAHDIKELRFSMGLTQHEFAEKIGVRPVTISRWENGANPTPLGLVRLLDIRRRQRRKQNRLKQAGQGD